MDTVVAGSLAALAVDLLIYPLDTIKTRLQASSVPSTTSSSPKAARPSAFQLRGLYQGVGSVVLITLPAAACFFTTYEGFKDLLLPPSFGQDAADDASQRNHVRLVASHAAASTTAELVSCLILTPAELIKQRAQVLRSTSSSSASSSSSSSLRAFRETFITTPTGVSPAKTLWRGYAALASRNLPYTALQFPLYEYLRARFARSFRLREPPSDSGRRLPRSSSISGSNTGEAKPAPKTSTDQILLSGAASALAGACAGSFAAFVTTPIDVVKTRIMLFDSSSSSSSSISSTKGRPAAPNGVLATMNHIYTNEGLRGLLRGAALRSAWTALGAGVYLSAYETGRVWWRERYM